MSLQSKLEAVIYAAEEPVTMAQLAALFADEALQWKADRNAADEGEKIGEVVPFEAVSRELGESEPEAVANQAGETSPEVSAETPPADPVATEGGDGPAAVEAPEEAPAHEEASEAEGKRLARARDREVKSILRELLDELIARYASDDSGVEIREIAGGYRMATKPEYHDAVRMFVRSLKPALKLSLPALETLAVIAYKQPVTAPEVNEIRGVDSSGVFGSLLARKLIATAGRKQVIGRPILYKTTREFLLRFGLKDVTELPSMEEFEKIAAMEFEEQEAAGEAGLEETAELDFAMEVEEESGESETAENDKAENQEEVHTAATAENAEAESPTPEIDGDSAKPELDETAEHEQTADHTAH
jgi:segregation and condensation protein B